MTSPDFRLVRRLSIISMLLLAAGVGWRFSVSSGDFVDFFFAVIAGLLAIAVFLLVRSSIDIVPRDGTDPLGPLVIVRNGVRTHRVPASSILVVDIVHPGDRDLAAVRPHPRRTQIVRLGLIDGPSVMVLALMVEPFLRIRSSGPQGLTAAVAALRTAAGIDVGSPDDPSSDDPGPDRRMGG
jgi:hypothetical protein